MKKIIIIMLILFIVGAEYIQPLQAAPTYARDYRVRLFSLEKKLNNVKISTVGANPCVRPRAVPLQYNIPIPANCDVLFTVNGKNKEIYCKNIYLQKDKIIITIDLEHLTEIVTLSEIHSYILQEYIKAQAVVARSFIASIPPKHAKDGYDFCDSTCCQVIKDIKIKPELENIIKSTKGECLYPVGAAYMRPLQSFYHSTCGGRTANAGDVFLKNVDGITSVEDILPLYKRQLCRDSAHFMWQFTISADKLREILNRRGQACLSPTNIGNYLLDIQTPVVQNGRVKKIKFIGQKVKLISGYDFYLLMGNKTGWGNIKSTCFTVKKVCRDRTKICRDRTMFCPYFVFTGRGLGHGIGMCQYGAYRMAELGYGYKDILKHYFPLAEVGIDRG